MFENFRRQFIQFGNRRLVTVTVDKASAAALARTASTIDSKRGFGGDTEIEDEVLELHSIFGGTDIFELLAELSFDEMTQVGTVAVKNPDSFVLDWTGTDRVTDHDLEITSPLAELLAPFNPAVPSGAYTMDRAAPVTTAPTTALRMLSGWMYRPCWNSIK